MPVIKNKWTLYFFAFLTINSFATSSYAFSIPSWDEIVASGRTIISLGGGASNSTDVGESKNFPIQNPTTDQFFIYSANKPSQTVGLFDGFLGAEWNLLPDWAVQMGLGYDQAWNFQAKGALVQGADVASEDHFSYQYHIVARQLLAEGKLLYQFNERYHPYVSAGLGVAFNTASDFSTTVPPFLAFTRQYDNHTQTSFTYNVGIGIDVDILKNFRAGIGYRFADFGHVKLGDATIDATKVSGTLSRSHLYANELVAQLTWLFC